MSWQCCLCLLGSVRQGIHRCGSVRECVYEYGCFGVWPLQGSYSGTFQTAPSKPHHVSVKTPATSVSSKNGVINTPPLLLNRRRGHHWPGTRGSLTLMCSLHGNPQSSKRPCGNHYGRRAISPIESTTHGRSGKSHEHVCPGEWAHPPIMVDFLDGYGAGEHFRWKFVPSNDYLALAQSATREKRNERR